MTTNTLSAPSAPALDAAGCRVALPHALFRDPPADPTAPAQTLAEAIPSAGVNLNAVLLTAAGAGPHPTVLLLHGLPGNEQNLDLAQSIRRAGWNVLTLHYRGSWGSPGVFSFRHCLEDGCAAVEWLRGAGAERVGQIDCGRIAVIGHSMGGFVAAHVTALYSSLLGAGLISGVALGPAFGAPDKAEATSIIDENVGASEGLHILAGTSPDMLAEEAGDRAEEWRLDAFAPALAPRPLLLVTSDDGFSAGSDALAGAVERTGSQSLRRTHFRTDHSYSDHRIALQIEVLTWLDMVNERPHRDVEGGG
jgi:pimeloyl-ACP methyl ester carboxylesterase